jgi:hypothetical protein
MIKNLLIAFSGVFLFFTTSRAQESITGLAVNPVIVEQIASLENQHGTGIRDSQDESPRLLLPFFDDFKQTWIFPSESRWADNYAFVNTSYPFRSANRGVATLDAIDNRGKLHQHASTFPFGSDSLTSHRIRLDSIFSPVPRPLTPDDSIYLSFYYQPQGLANPPEPFDSLVLSFGYYTGRMVFAGYYDSIYVPLASYIQPGDTVFPGDTLYSPSGQCDPGLFVISSMIYTYGDSIEVPCDSVLLPEYRWKTVWSSPGMKLQDFYAQYGTYSRQVMIPIKDTIYFDKDFRFRFHNFASIAPENSPSQRSNCDQWNLDYIYLNRNRSYQDTTYRDVSFVERAPSLLLNYQAMPYRQYVNDPTNEIKTNIELVISNLDSITYNTNYYYAVYEVNGAFQYLYPGGSCNLSPFYENGYQDCISCAAHACPPTNFLFPLTTRDSAEFEVRHILIGDITPVDTVADTLKFRQKFFNYYAYDDGTPEAGYVVIGAPGASVAYQFRLNTGDTLRAVQMFFNRTFSNATNGFFDLKVWRDNNGKPGDQVYVQPLQRVFYSETLNEFHTYMLDEPLAVNGVFYIGYSYLSGEHMNLGYDFSNNAQARTYVNTEGAWSQSTFQGALMMRPMLGKEFSPTGTAEPVLPAISFTIYPNPVTGEDFHIRNNGNEAGIFHEENYHIRIYTTLGTILYDGKYRNTFTSVLPSPGIYLIQILDKSNTPVFISKIIKH